MDFCYFIGIDIAKDTLDWAVYTQEGIRLSSHTDNTISAIKSALVELKSLPGWNPKQAIFCMEHTGIYNAHLDGVLTTLAQLTKLDTVCDSERTKLVAYYQQNRLRMQCGTFRGQGLLISSGLVEAAHRTVIQCRMKRSGQRWTIDGAQAMLNLRVALKSDRWHLVTQSLNM